MRKVAAKSRSPHIFLLAMEGLLLLVVVVVAVVLSNTDVGMERGAVFQKVGQRRKLDSPAFQIAAFNPNPGPALSRGFGRTKKKVMGRTAPIPDQDSQNTTNNPKTKTHNLSTLRPQKQKI